MTPQQYLVQAARNRGYNPLDLATVMQHESSLNPDVWGGKDGKYYGLIQFGPDERKQFGVNTLNPSFNNQVDAAMNFLDKRGYKPTMGLLDMYSTVLAGSPGHYNRADQNGSVAEHVSKMDADKVAAQKWLGAELAQNAAQSVGKPMQLSSAAPSTNTQSDNSDPIGELIKKDELERSQAWNNVGQYGHGLLGAAQPGGQVIAQSSPLSPIPMAQATFGAHIPDPSQFRKIGLLGR